MRRATPASSFRWWRGRRRGPPRRRSAPSIRRRNRSSACPSRSRTISTSPACRRPPPARTSPTRRSDSAPVVERLVAAGAILIGKTNLDQFATGLVGVRTPYPVPRNASTRRSSRAARRPARRVAVARGIVSLRARHRHRRLRPRAGGAQQHRRAEAELRRDLDPRRGAGLPHARLRLDLRRHASTTPGRRSAVAAGYDAADPYSRAIAARRAGAAAGAAARRPGREEPHLRQRRGGGGVRRGADAARRAQPRRGAARRPTSRPSSRRRGFSTKARGSPSAMPRSASFIEAKPEALHPVTRAIIEGARSLSAADAFDGEYRLRRARRATDAAFWRDFDVLVVPSIPDVCTLADVGGRADRRQLAARHLHQLRQPARPLRSRRARPVPRATAARPASR